MTHAHFYVFLYSYFENGCRKTWTRQSRKVLWVVLRSLFFTEILKKWHETRGHRLCFRVLKQSSKSRFDSYSVRNSVLIISHITFRDCRVHFFPNLVTRSPTAFSSVKQSEIWIRDYFFPTTFLEIAVCILTIY